MPEALADKLAEEIARTGHYPPIVVRPYLDGYQILDGHHRVMVLRRLGHETAHCVVWDVDDQDALLFLATLNRLSGEDDPRKRAALVSELRQSLGVDALAKRLPEDAEKIQKLLDLHAAPPSPRPPMSLEQMPVCLHFFLLPSQRRAVDKKLREHGGGREAALLSLLGIEAVDA